MKYKRVLQHSKTFSGYFKTRANRLLEGISLSGAGWLFLFITLRETNIQTKHNFYNEQISQNIKKNPYKW